MTDTTEVVKLKRDWLTQRSALASIRQWLSKSFDDSQEMLDEAQQYLSLINGVLGHENEVSEFLVGTDDDDDCVGRVSDDACRSGRSDPGCSA